MAELDEGKGCIRDGAYLTISSLLMKAYQDVPKAPPSAPAPRPALYDYSWNELFQPTIRRDTSVINGPTDNSVAIALIQYKRNPTPENWHAVCVISAMNPEFLERLVGCLYLVKKYKYEWTDYDLRDKFLVMPLVARVVVGRSSTNNLLDIKNAVASIKLTRAADGTMTDTIMLPAVAIKKLQDTKLFPWAKSLLFEEERKYHQIRISFGDWGSFEAFSSYKAVGRMYTQYLHLYMIVRRFLQCDAPKKFYYWRHLVDYVWDFAYDIAVNKATVVMRDGRNIHHIAMHPNGIGERHECLIVRL